MSVKLGWYRFMFFFFKLLFSFSEVCEEGNEISNVPYMGLSPFLIPWVMFLTELIINTHTDMKMISWETSPIYTKWATFLWAPNEIKRTHSHPPSHVTHTQWIGRQLNVSHSSYIHCWLRQPIFNACTVNFENLKSTPNDLLGWFSCIPFPFIDIPIHLIPLIIGGLRLAQEVLRKCQPLLFHTNRGRKMFSWLTTWPMLLSGPTRNKDQNGHGRYNQN